MKYVIMGCGRVGAKLAQMLDAEGHDVSVVDSRPEALARLGVDFKGTAIVGTGVDEDILRQAGIESAAGFAAVTDDDNDNIMASQVAQLVFKVPTVTTRIYDPLRVDLFAELGLRAVCPTIISAEQLREAIETGKPLANCTR